MPTTARTLGGSNGRLRSLVVALAAALPAYWTAAAPSDDGDFDSYRRSIPGAGAEFEMVAIPGGAFLMGSPEDEPERDPSEGPQVEVKIESFWMGKHEVTWSEYHAFMALNNVFEKFNDSRIRQPDDIHGVDVITAPSKLYEPGFTYTPGKGLRQPAVSMSQYAAKQYTKWLSLLTGDFYRLPTEAEWEYACRSGSSAAYSFGDDPEKLDEYGWYYDNSEDMTHDVGTKKPNAWGLYDMHGNACEWVLDEHRPDWYASLAGKSPSQAEALCWPTQLFPRVLRGGSWNLDPPDCRSAARRPSHDDDWRSYDPNSPQSPWWFASDESQDVGFRIVRPRTPPPREDWAKYWDADLPEIQEVVDHRIDDEGRGERGTVDPELPAAIEQLEVNATAPQ